MISHVQGLVQEVGEKRIVLQVGGFLGLSLGIPTPESLQIGTQSTIYTYLHWNQEHGPSLFGFHTPLQRTLFLAIIECPKIGPSIALSILHQLKVGQFIEIITTQNQKALSAINGIGPKKAEQLIVALKHPIQKILAGDMLPLQGDTASETVADWQQLNEVLLSLNYSKQEISAVLQQISQRYAGQQVNFDQLLRNALGLLASKAP